MGETNLISNVIGWVTGNWDGLLLLLTQIVGLVSIIVKLTPTLKDDDVLKPIIRFLGKYIALNRGSGSPK